VTVHTPLVVLVAEIFFMTDNSIMVTRHEDNLKYTN